MTFLFVPLITTLRVEIIAKEFPAEEKIAELKIANLVEIRNLLFRNSWKMLAIRNLLFRNFCLKRTQFLKIF